MNSESYWRTANQKYFYIAIVLACLTAILAVLLWMFDPFYAFCALFIGGTAVIGFLFMMPEQDIRAGLISLLMLGLSAFIGNLLYEELTKDATFLAIHIEQFPKLEMHTSSEKERDIFRSVLPNPLLLLIFNTGLMLSIFLAMLSISKWKSLYMRWRKGYLCSYSNAGRFIQTMMEGGKGAVIACIEHPPTKKYVEFVKQPNPTEFLVNIDMKLFDDLQIEQIRQLLIQFETEAVENTPYLHIRIGRNTDIATQICNIAFSKELQLQPDEMYCYKYCGYIDMRPGISHGWRDSDTAKI